jgi:hypothetical protein
LVPGWFGGCWRHNLAVPAICPFIRGCLVDIKIAGGCIEIFNHPYIWKNIGVDRFEGCLKIGNPIHRYMWWLLTCIHETPIIDILYYIIL